MRPQIDQAPMEGVVDFVLRDILSEIGGLSRCVTEFVRVTDRIVPDHTFLHYCPELTRSGQTRTGVPVYVQLLGGKPEWLAPNAKAAVALGAPGIDLNFGCPAKTVNRHDGGATLLKTPSRLYDCISAVRDALPSSIPVTAKVRLGFDHKNDHLEIASAVERAGASCLTIHARTRNEAYIPPAHWDYIARMREHVRLPVVANGEIWTVQDFVRCRNVTGCERFALGRGLIARPSLAREILGEPSLAWGDILPFVVRFVQMSEAFRQDAYALSRLKQWTKFLSRTYPEAQTLFDKVKICLKLSDAWALLEMELKHATQNSDLHLEQLPLLRAQQEPVEAKRCFV